MKKETLEKVDEAICELAETVINEKDVEGYKLSSNANALAALVTASTQAHHILKSPGDGDITEVERLFFEKGYGKEK